MNRMTLFVFLTAVIVLAVLLQFRSVNIPETDSLYHFRHAAMYLETGILTTAFPWVQYSVINEHSADIWYGFHLLLMPFTYAGDPVFGLRLAGVFMTAFLLIAVFWSLGRLGVTLKFIWPFLLFLSAPFVTYHLAMTRPHIVSLAFNLLFFSFLATENFLGILLASFGAAFFHLSLFWSSLLIVAVFAGAKLFTEKIFVWRQILIALSGLVLGWLARPNPWGAAKITYAQIVQLMLEKQAGTPLNFGMELYPLRLADIGMFAPFIALWLASAAVFLYAASGGRGIEQRHKTALWSSLMLSFTFFLMTMFVAQRSFDLWAAFGVVFIALAFSFALNVRWRKNAATAIIIWLIVMSAYGVNKTGWYISTIGYDPYRFQPAAVWLRDNSKPGDIIFNVSWDNFPELFFWNAKNFYVSGMDPIFQYVYDPKLYWRAYYLETGKTTQFTCAAVACRPDELEETYTILKRDFKAEYVFLDKYTHPEFYNYLKRDRRFELGYEDDSSAIFAVR